MEPILSHYFMVILPANEHFSDGYKTYRYSDNAITAQAFHDWILKYEKKDATVIVCDKDSYENYLESALGVLRRP